MQAPTPAMVNQNDVLDDDEDEPLNENDDDDDLDDVDQGEELNTQHLVLAQFDKVYHIHLVPFQFCYICLLCTFLKKNNCSLVIFLN